MYSISFLFIIRNKHEIWKWKMFIPENIKYNNYNLQFLRSYSKPHREWGGLIWGHIDIIQTYILKFIYTSRIKKLSMKNRKVYQ